MNRNSNTTTIKSHREHKIKIDVIRKMGNTSKTQEVYKIAQNPSKSL